MAFLFSGLVHALQLAKIANFIRHPLLVKWFRHHKCLTQVRKVQFQSCQMNDNTVTNKKRKRITKYYTEN